MIENLPGFLLEEVDRETRGFGSAGGNLLIDGKRVSAKAESSSSLLARISADDVIRIELIRGRVGGLDLPGQAVVANVVRSKAGHSGTWSAGASQFRPETTLHPWAALSYAGQTERLSYAVSIEASGYQDFVESSERVTDVGGSFAEGRDETLDIDGEEYVFSLTGQSESARAVVSGTLSARRYRERGGENSLRRPAGTPAFNLLRKSNETEDAIEMGLDAERQFASNWTTKVIGLYRRSDYNDTESLLRVNAFDPAIEEVATASTSVDTESVLRFESTYKGVSNQLWQIALEGVINQLDSEFALAELTGGELMRVVVPGANTEVKEERIDLRIANTLQRSELSMEIALGAEASKISQRGDFQAKRRFFFLKPSLAVTYAASDKTQYRMQVSRDVGQLDFFDFVSAADLDDAELSLGNASLSPEATTRLEFAYQHQFGAIGNVSATVYHDWIKDAQDLLPLDGQLEIPGNIGQATRTGGEIELTMPIDAMGLRRGRLDASVRWQTSAVDDPLTGQERALSGESDWEWQISIRQDLTGQKFAWGITLFGVDDAPFFGLDELEDQGKRFDADAFIETQAFKSWRLRLGVENIFRGGFDRDRRVYAGPRNASTLSFREIREEQFARELFFEMKGTF